MADGTELTHITADGSAHMVDVSGKATTKRVATAQAVVRTRPEVIGLLIAGDLPKGEPLAVARVAGILAAKQTSSLIPLCHPLPLSGVTVEFSTDESTIRIETSVSTTGVTGVEMEALTAASVAALTLYDMIKAVDRGATITDIEVLSKSGGASGEWTRA
ncbi:cyclic pyranopterin monophosphate synthase MoaC [Herbiconiux sp. CPCC 205763]|uniref:Cyclic pyranopterin monophosphate synthase n=1 Tax=Herbiconiux aconitum TaxID=2970913 RepID=A0ABT2GS28_9MICO|nr:cyclic pyranopterin monophosphate synthase MoaC [Herbiconiux aconitum]MCS5718968.1 cyclic pyranopterin monophosphate synthase MoaC [Herbiconiux aconitum]